MKKIGLILLIGGIAVLALGLGGGIALAQTLTPEPETTAPDGAWPGGYGRRGFYGMDRWGGFGRNPNDSTWLENLAKSLGITVDRLTAAQDEARQAMIAEAVAAGQITQAQADTMQARHALQPYINQRAILATALGMSAEDLDAALTDGQTLSDLMNEKGIDAATLQTNAQAAYESALKQAVTDGAITQAQADEFLTNGFNMFGRGGFPGGCDGLGSRNGDGYRGGNGGTGGNGSGTRGSGRGIRGGGL